MRHITAILFLGIVTAIPTQITWADEIQSTSAEPLTSQCRQAESEKIIQQSDTTSEPFAALQFVNPPIPGWPTGDSLFPVFADAIPSPNAGLHTPRLVPVPEATAQAPDASMPATPMSPTISTAAPLAPVNLVYSGPCSYQPGTENDAFCAAIAVKQPSILKAGLGFIYLRPYWSRNDFTITLPTPTGSLVGDSRDVTQAFNLSPIVQMDLSPAVGSVGLSMSGYFTQLNSTLSRNVTGGNGNANLNASDALSLWVANLPEIILPKGAVPGTSPFVFHAGFRFNQIQQSFASTLTSAPNSVHLQSAENFLGFGGTCALEWNTPVRFCKCHLPLSFFTLVRGSVTVGTNQRSSSYGTSIGPNGTLFANSISENRISLVPVGELYSGIEFQQPVAALRFTRSCYDGGAAVTIRLGFTGQIWGDVGMPSAVASTQANNGSLYLVGLLVAAGINF
jgi:hypothetical protein